MRFDDEDEDHKINMPINFKKINEILDSNNFKSEPQSGFDDGSDYGVTPRKGGVDETNIRNPIAIKKTVSDKTEVPDATIRSTPSLERIVK